MLTSKSRLPLKQIILVGCLPSFIKVPLYRLKGYKIGRNVSLGFGSVIQAEDAEIGDGASIGFLTIIRGRKVKIGRHVQIGATTFLDTPHIEIGEGSKINEQVFVGGLQFPDSKFIIGRNCQIMQMSFINPTRSITMGDDSGIGGHCLLFGHTSWLSKFEGYPAEFDSIEIGKSVSISWRVFMLPGSTVGDGSIIGANSMVRGAIPAQSLAVGFPARVVSAPPEFPRAVSDGEKVQYLNEISAEMIEYMRGFGLACAQTGDDWMVSEKTKGWFGTRVSSWTLRILSTRSEPLDQAISRSPVSVLVSLHALTSEQRKKLDASGCLWIDIQHKERSELSNELGEEVAMYLRRYGVRLIRQPTA